MTGEFRVVEKLLLEQASNNFLDRLCRLRADAELRYRMLAERRRLG